VKKVLALCTVLLSLLPCSAMAQTNSSADALEELAARLMSYGGDTVPEFFVGALPDQAQLKLEVPLPQGAKVIGAAKRFENYFEIVLDVRADADAILSFYNSSLKGFENRGAQYSGWRGGFAFSAQDNFSMNSKDALFCKGDQAFSVTVHRTNAAIKDVRIQLNRFNCGDPRISITLPKLLPPASSDVASLTSFSQGMRSIITLRASDSPKTVFDHYAAQLEAAKWKRGEVVTMQIGIASTFDFTDDQNRTWRMFFTVHQSSSGAIEAQIFAFGV
jgi:hypothetical protein